MEIYSAIDISCNILLKCFIFGCDWNLNETQFLPLTNTKNVSWVSNLVIRLSDRWFVHFCCICFFVSILAKPFPICCRVIRSLHCWIGVAAAIALVWSNRTSYTILKKKNKYVYFFCLYLFGTPEIQKQRAQGY